MSRNLGLWQVQAGKQTSRDTGVAPTAKLMGVSDFTATPLRESEQAAEKRGTLHPGYNAKLLKTGGDGALSVNVSFEDILFGLNGLFDEATPTGEGPYTWPYAAPGSALPTPRVQSLVYGDEAGAYRLVGALAGKFNLKAETGAFTTAQIDWVGYDVEPATLAALSDRTVNLITGDMWTVYIDAWDGTMGATEIANTAFLFDLEIDPGRHNVRHLGSLTPTGWDDAETWKGALKLELELAGSAITMVSNILSGSPVGHQIRLKATDGADRGLQIDFTGRILGAPELVKGRDGKAAIELAYTPQYNPTFGDWLAVAVTNEVSAIP